MNEKSSSELATEHQIKFLSWCRSYAETIQSDISEEEHEFKWNQLCDSIGEYVKSCSNKDLMYLFSSCIVWFNSALQMSKIPEDKTIELFYDHAIMNLFSDGQETTT